MATALTLGLKPQISTAVTSYFRRFRVLPPRGLSVSKTRVLFGAHSFETLLRAIIAEKSETDFVIVVHGHETGDGLFLKLATRGVAAGEQTTHEMLQLLMDIEARKPPPPKPGTPAPKPGTPAPLVITPQDRSKTKLTDAEIKRLIDLRKQVLAKKINRIEFRGCNLGRNLASVDRFRTFLGAKTFGAPKLHSFFGTFQMRASSGVMSSHTSSHKGTTITYPMTFASSTAACCFGLDTDRKPDNGHLVAPDSTTLDAWIKANFDPAASAGTDTTLPIHGLWEFPPTPKGAPFPLDPRPIFPRRVVTIAKKVQTEYSMHIVYK
jgi:hypothetical protein